MKYLGFTLLLLCLLNGCVEVIEPFQKVPPGKWRATLQVSEESARKIIDTDNETDRIFTELSEGELPFTFDVSYEQDSNMIVTIYNGAEAIRVDDVIFGRDEFTKEDTIRINFPIYDTYIRGRYEENRIQGFWVVNYRDQYQIPFDAVYGQEHRFTNLRKEPSADLTGKWETTFLEGTEDEYKGIGEFKQNGNKLTGTFITETGDYRFLEGTVQDDKAYLSCFDGTHAYLFQAKIIDDGSLIGSFRSGKHYTSTWNAKRNDAFELSDPNTLTYIKGQEKFYFECEDLDGNPVHINDAKYQNRPMLVSIFGTWCPNCKDEMAFLKEYFEKHPEQKVDVVVLAFERYDDAQRNKAMVRTFKEKMDIPFDMLYAGRSGKEAHKKLPMLNKIVSYPTLIFLDRNKDVRKIHTGFSGPATSKYASFAEDFSNSLNDLLNE